MVELYEQRRAERAKAEQEHEETFRSLAWWRLAIVIAGAILAWYNFRLLPLPLAIFIALLYYHDRIARKQALEKRAIAFYQRGIDRILGRWTGFGEKGERFLNPHHPYAGDLDVFGEGSVFQLINAARTAAGEETLARWLSEPSLPDQVRRRQEAIRELTGRLELREDLALLGEDVRAELHTSTLLKWGSAPPEPIHAAHRLAAALIAIALFVGLTGYMLDWWTLWPLLLAILARLAFQMVMNARISRILAWMELPAHDLGILAELIQRIEREPFESPYLAELQQRLRTEGKPAAKQIAELQRLIAGRDQSRHFVFAIMAEPLLWSAQFAMAIERWRQNSGPHLAEWLAAIGEIEALSSFAGYAAEHPENVYPELSDDGPAFSGRGVAHPLLGPEAIANDVRLDTGLQLLVVSGSNMSGKSTLLRSIGLNTVLAWAGAPVRARHLRISPLCVGASMRIQDSLLHGASRFYAEITRLRQIVDMANGHTPLLFLLDELLSGTNSHDRAIGAEAVVRNLVERGSIGLVTTHDLALAHIAESLDPRAANVHFEDHIENGRIAFDYRMRPGIVQKSNALELMRSVGLEV